MNSLRQARAIAHPTTLAWPQVDLRMIGLRVLPFLFCLVASFLLTATRIQITRERYELSDLNRQRQSLSAEVTRLEVEAAVLSSPKRIEGIARRLGFTYADRDAVVMLDE